MENDGRMGVRCIMAPEQANHAVLKEYAAIRLMQVLAERDAAIVERDHALAEKKAALTERDSAILQRDIAYAERDAAILERDNALVALDSARGHRAIGWNPYKKQPDGVKGCDSAIMLQMSPFSGVEDNHSLPSDSPMLGFLSNSERLQHHQLHHQQMQLQQQQQHHQQPQQHPHQPPSQQEEHHRHPPQHQYHQQQQHCHHHHQQQQQQQRQQEHQQQQQIQQPQLLLLHQHHQQQDQEHPQEQEQEQEQGNHHETPPPPLPQQQQRQENGKPRKEETSKAKRNRKATGDDALKPEPKKKRLENDSQMQESTTPPLLPVVPYHAQEAESDINDEMNLQMEDTQDMSYVVNTPIPHCSCTGNIEPCYRWGNGGWQSACCTTTLSMHPLPMNPLKKGYRLPGRKMSAGAFQKLVKRLAQEGADLTQPIDLKDYWSKHGTNRYVTIK